MAGVLVQPVAPTLVDPVTSWRRRMPDDELASALRPLLPLIERRNIAGEVGVIGELILTAQPVQVSLLFGRRRQSTRAVTQLKISGSMVEIRKETARANGARDEVKSSVWSRNVVRTKGSGQSCGEQFKIGPTSTKDGVTLNAGRRPLLKVNRATSRSSYADRHRMVFRAGSARPSAVTIALLDRARHPWPRPVILVRSLMSSTPDD